MSSRTVYLTPGEEEMWWRGKWKIGWVTIGNCDKVASLEADT